MDVDLRHLRTLLAVVDEGTFTDAAARLRVSQATVSRTIATLETALGVRLLQRTTRHVALTGTGAQVAAHARRVLDELAQLHRVVERSRTELRVGYAWAALGRHTRRVQKRWAAAHPRTPLVFVQSNSPTAGLAEGTADVAVVRRALDDARFDTVVVGAERRVAAVSTDGPLARRRTLRLADLTPHTVAIDDRTGTTSLDLWTPGPAPATVRPTRSVDEWLTLIAAGQAVGVTPEATADQYPRPGVSYKTLRDAPTLQVRLAWWRDDVPKDLADLVTMAGEAYRSGKPQTRDTTVSPR